MKNNASQVKFLFAVWLAAWDGTATQLPRISLCSEFFV
jgi:hypothetical protein